MSLTNCLEVCITRKDIGRTCNTCRYNGDECLKMHIALMNEHRELLSLKKRGADNAGTETEER